MTARIYRPARNAMQSGTARTHDWVLEYTPATPRGIDPLMGWTSSSDMNSQIRLSFPTREAALAYAGAEGIEAVVHDPHERKYVLRAQGYGENYAHNRRGTWTH
ncbi:MAG: ETC complex I subunit [Rubellimicrobium sp.]|nr:ETC complex I subunit [Rubellimicrobium sp.]